MQQRLSITRKNYEKELKGNSSVEKYNNLNENLLKGLSSTFELAEERISKFKIDHYE